MNRSKFVGARAAAVVLGALPIRAAELRHSVCLSRGEELGRSACFGRFGGRFGVGFLGRRFDEGLIAQGV